MYNLSTEEIRKYIVSNELFKAILETSATLEELFFSQIMHEIKICPDLISSWTLGKLLVWVDKCHLIINREKYYPLLKDFIKLRNIVIHSGQYLLKNSTQEIESGIINHLIKICEYVSLSPVRDGIKDIDEKANRYLIKDVEKNLKFLNKYNQD